ncbi:MAG: hypothetical protein ACI86S_001995 [Paracoccaceae bacterium]|jgi:hypothetical protein
MFRLWARNQGQARRVGKPLVHHAIARVPIVCLFTQTAQLRTQDCRAQVVHAARHIGRVVFDILEHVGRRGCAVPFKKHITAR